MKSQYSPQKREKSKKFEITNNPNVTARLVHNLSTKETTMLKKAGN